MNRRTRLFSALAVSGALCACIDEPIDDPIDISLGPDAGTVEDEVVDEEVRADHDAIYGVFEVGTLWDEDTITVCWESNAMDFGMEEERDAVRAAAAKWEAVSRIRFNGWVACTPSSNADIRINHVLAAGESLLGIASRGHSPSMVLNFFCDPSGGCIPDDQYAAASCAAEPVKRCLKEAALHEFGHALGLRHEQAHTNETCVQDEHGDPIGEEDLDFEVEEGWVHDETEEGWVHDGEDLWSYDAESVMNYCVDRTELSQGDVQSITSLYPSQVSVYADAGLGGARTVVGPGKTLAPAGSSLASGASIVVSAGLTANVCTSANTCQSLGVGRHDLNASVANAIASIEVTPRISVMASAGFRGFTFTAQNGTYHANGGGLPFLFDNTIESVYVGHNFDVRMCPDVGSGTGAGVCHVFPGGPEWDQALFVKIGPQITNTASYVEVIPKVAFYDEVDFRGTGATYRQGVYGTQPGFTKARSLTIPPALYVYACNGINAQGGPSGTCRTYNDSVKLPDDHAASLKYVSIQKKVVFQWP